MSVLLNYLHRVAVHEKFDFNLGTSSRKIFSIVLGLFGRGGGGGGDKEPKITKMRRCTIFE